MSSSANSCLFDGSVRLSIIVAASTNHVIGRDQNLPWYLPDDFKFFKAMTLGKVLWMGRKNFESIGKPLPGRDNIVLSRSQTLIDGVTVVNTLAEAYTETVKIFQVKPETPREIMVIGGADLYRQLLPFTTTVYLTRIMSYIEGDIVFPELAEFSVSPSGSSPSWRLVNETYHLSDERHAHAFTIQQFDRQQTGRLLANLLTVED